MTQQEARTLVYSLLAGPLYEPSSAFLEAVSQGQWSSTLNEALAAQGLALEVPSAPPAEVLAGEYHRIFRDPIRPLRPIESLFKPWTTDPEAEVLPARERGWLGGDPAAHLKALYQELGIEVPEALSYAPDHLALELEFMSFLVERGTQIQQELFRQQHLDWLPDLVAEADRLGVSGFYRDLIRLIGDYLALDPR
jgi:TorA maturation chaperone TorD